MIENGVRLWAFDGVTAKDKETMQDFYEQRGTIVEKDDEVISEYECLSE